MRQLIALDRVSPLGPGSSGETESNRHPAKKDTPVPSLKAWLPNVRPEFFPTSEG